MVTLQDRKCCVWIQKEILKIMVIFLLVLNPPTSFLCNAIIFCIRRCLAIKQTHVSSYMDFPLTNYCLFQLPPPSFSQSPCTPADTEGCEHTWRKFHGHCYRYFTRRHTWEDAEKDCREHSGHLASIHSLAEQNFIRGGWGLRRKRGQGQTWHRQCRL